MLRTLRELGRTEGLLGSPARTHHAHAASSPGPSYCSVHSPLRTNLWRPETDQRDPRPRQPPSRGTWDVGICASVVTISDARSQSGWRAVELLRECVLLKKRQEKKKISLIEHLTEAFLSGLHFIANGCCHATSFPSQSHFCSFEVLEFDLREHPHQHLPPPPPFQGLAQGSEVGGGLRGNLHCSSWVSSALIKKKKKSFPSLISSPLALS